MPDIKQATETPLVEEVEQQPVGKKFHKEYQLTDTDGNPIGPPQVFEGDDPQEVIDAIANAHLHASRKINELKRYVKPETVEAPARLEAKNLTDNEKWELANKLTNGETIDEALDKILEARLGAPVERVRSLLNRTAEMDAAQKAMAEAQAFVDSTPEYKVCPENQAAIEKFMQEQNLAWTKRNLEFAFDSLKVDGLVKLNEPEQKTVKAEQVVPAKTEEIASEPARPATRPRGTTSTGLFSHHSSASDVKTNTNESFAEEIAKMSPAEYKRRMLIDPSFVKKVNALGKK